MPDIFLDISLSLDGMSAGSSVSASLPMGLEGERLHAWLFAQASVEDQAAAAAPLKEAGAVVMGRRTFDAGIGLWGDDGAFGMPCFVVTHRAHDPVLRTSTRFDFVTGGIGPALDAARAAAGDRKVWLLGGAGLARQYLAAGLVDEVRVHLVPIVLGQGVSLFAGLAPAAFDPLPPVHAPSVTHLRWRARR